MLYRCVTRHDTAIGSPCEAWALACCVCAAGRRNAPTAVPPRRQTRAPAYRRLPAACPSTAAAQSLPSCVAAWSNSKRFVSETQKQTQINKENTKKTNTRDVQIERGFHRLESTAHWLILLADNVALQRTRNAKEKVANVRFL